MVGRRHGQSCLGANHRTVRINGRTVTDVPNSGMTVERGGLLTSEVTNIGNYSDTDFAVIPEFRLGLGVCVTKCCSVRAGYNVIYWGGRGGSGWSAIAAGTSSRPTQYSAGRTVVGLSPSSPASAARNSSRTASTPACSSSGSNG